MFWLQKIPENFIYLFFGLKFYSIWVSPTTKFYPILMSPTTKFDSILVSSTTAHPHGVKFQSWKKLNNIFSKFFKLNKKNNSFPIILMVKTLKNRDTSPLRFFKEKWDLLFDGTDLYSKKEKENCVWNSLS